MVELQTSLVEKGYVELETVSGSALSWPSLLYKTMYLNFSGIFTETGNEDVSWFLHCRMAGCVFLEGLYHFAHFRLDRNKSMFEVFFPSFQLAEIACYYVFLGYGLNLGSFST